MKPKNDIDWVNALAALKAAKAARKGVPWWVWFCIPLALLVCGMAFSALNPDKTRGSEYVKGQDGNYHHRTKTVWQLAAENARVGEELVTERDSYIYESYAALDAGRREKFKSKAAWEKYHQRWQGKKLLFIPAGRTMRVEYNEGTSDDVMVVTPIPYGAEGWYIRHEAFLPK